MWHVPLALRFDLNSLKFQTADDSRQVSYLFPVISCIKSYLGWGAREAELLSFLTRGLK